MNLVFTVVLLSLVSLASAIAQDSVRVKAGWNIIGSVATGAITDIVCTSPPGIITTDFYGYVQGIGYYSTDTLEKGLGYWIKTNSDGLVIFNGECAEGGGACSVGELMYEGELYLTIEIGSQCWLRKNLNVGTMVSIATEQSDDGIIEKYCPMNSPGECDSYGGLYQWNEAMQYSATPGTQGICPPGWHIPTYAEFQTLSSAVGGDGNALKETGQGTGGGTGTNTSGFTALLAGYRDGIVAGHYNNFGTYAYLWSSTETDTTYTKNMLLSGSDASIGLNVAEEKSHGFSVRCLED